MGARERRAAFCAGRRAAICWSPTRVSTAWCCMCALRGWIASRRADGDLSGGRRRGLGSFVQRAVDENCAGIECLAGIPGRWAERRCRTWALTGRRSRRRSSECELSILQRVNFVEFTARNAGLRIAQPIQYGGPRPLYGDAGGLPLDQAAARRRCAMRICRGPSRRDAQPTLLEVAGAVRRIRRNKGMLLVEGDPDCRSAGSFFKNPVVSEEGVQRVTDAAGKEPPRFPAGAAGCEGAGSDG